MKTIKVPVQIVPLSEADFSDNGKWVDNIEADIDYHLLLKRLSTRQRRALELKERGYSLIEIAQKLKIDRITLWREMKQIRKIFSIIK